MNINKSKNDNSSVTIQTRTNYWVIPHNCELLKALLQQQKLKAGDLQFNGTSQCKSFLKNLFLLALEDETKNQCPSILAQFGREIIQLQCQQN